MSAKERDVIIRRGQLEAEAEKLKEIKLKKEKEKKAKAEAAEKNSSHKDPPKDGSRKKKKKSNKESKESSGKDGSKDAAAGVGTLRGDWVCIPATREPRKLNHVRDHGDRVCSTATRDLMVSSTSRSTTTPLLQLPARRAQTSQVMMMVKNS